MLNFPPLNRWHKDQLREGRVVSIAPLIHVIDDDELVRTALLRLLTAAGFEACGYGSAGEFLLRPPPDRPGCLLLDVRLPGPSGLDCKRQCMIMRSTCQLNFLMAHADVSSSVRALKSGAVDFLEKPVDRDTLLGALGSALARDLEMRNERDHSRQLRGISFRPPYAA